MDKKTILEQLTTEGFSSTSKEYKKVIEVFDRNAVLKRDCSLVKLETIDEVLKRVKEMLRQDELNKSLLYPILREAVQNINGNNDEEVMSFISEQWESAKENSDLLYKEAELKRKLAEIQEAKKALKDSKKKTKTVVVDFLDNQ